MQMSREGAVRGEQLRRDGGEGSVRGSLCSGAGRAIDETKTGEIVHKWATRALCSLPSLQVGVGISTASTDPFVLLTGTAGWAGVRGGGPLIKLVIIICLSRHASTLSSLSGSSQTRLKGLLSCVCRGVGIGSRGKQVGSMSEESQVRGCYNITFICTPTKLETVSVLEKTQANKTFRT